MNTSGQLVVFKFAVHPRGLPRATAFACDDVDGLVDAVREVLGLANLTRNQREGVAATVSEQARAVPFGVVHCDAPHMSTLPANRAFVG